MKTITTLATALALGALSGGAHAQDSGTVQPQNAGPPAPGSAAAGSTDPLVQDGVLPTTNPADPVTTLPPETVRNNVEPEDLPDAVPDSTLDDTLEPTEPADPDDALEPSEVEPYPDTGTADSLDDTGPGEDEDALDPLEPADEPMGDGPL